MRSNPKTTVAQPRANTPKGDYDGRELTDRSIDRPGAHDHEKCPSLIGNRRVWRDGRTEARMPEGGGQ